QCPSTLVPEVKTLVLIVVLIAATAILITVMPALRRSLERARPSQPRVSRGPVPSEHPEGPVLVVEAPPQRHVPPGGSDEEDPLLRPEGERPVPGRREGPSPGFPR